MIALLILYRRKETNRGQLTCPKSHSWYGGTWVQTQISPNHKACDLKGPPTCLAPGAGFMEDSSSPDQRWEGGEQFLDDSSTLHLLCALFLLLLHQLHLRSLGIRSWNLGTPGLEDILVLLTKWQKENTNGVSRGGKKPKRRKLGERRLKGQEGGEKKSSGTSGQSSG